MKKKYFFVMALLIASVLPVWSQNLTIVSSQRMSCLTLYVRGNDIYRTVDYVTLNEYNDGSFQIVLLQQWYANRVLSTP